MKIYNKKISNNLKLSEINFKGLNLSKSSFKGKYLNKCDFWESKLENINFENTVIKNSIFTDANLFKSSFLNSKLIDINFTHANLRNVNFKGCFFKNVNLRDAIYDAKTKWPKHFSPEVYGAIKYVKSIKLNKKDKVKKAPKNINKIVNALTKGKGYYVVENYFKKENILKAQKTLRTIVFKDKKIKENQNKFSKDKRYCQKWITNLLNINPILGEFIKSGLLFNDNISLNTSLVVKSNANQEIFQDAKINLHIVNGKIDLNKTSLSNNDIGSLELNNSNLFFKDDKLIFGGDIFVDIKNTNRFFSFLNTNKSLRRDLKSIIINFEYNFSNNKIKFKNITIDNKDVSDQLLPIIENFNESSINNINIGRSLINELLSNYDG